MLPVLPRLIVSALVALGASSSAMAQQNTEKFPIDAYEISGNQLFSKEQLERLVRPFTGPAQSVADIRDAQRTIEGIYRAAGYGTVRAITPEQELTGGKVRIEIVEAKIDKVTVSGNTHFSETNIRASLPSLVVGKVQNIRELSENIQLANENPAKRVEVVLNSLNEQAALEARVVVQDEKALRLSMNLENTGNETTGRYRLGVALQHANVLGRDHVMTLAYITSPDKPEKVDIYSLSYRLPLYALGDSMDFIAGYSSVNAGTTQTVAGPLAFNGMGRVFGIRYNHYFPRQGEFSSRLTLGLDQRAYDANCLISGFSCGTADADVTVRPVSLSWLGQWVAASERTDSFVTLAQNISGGKNAGNADFDAARAGASASFATLRYGVSHMQTARSGWQLRAALNGQYSPDTLVQGEQFGLAGAASVRGFEERAVSVDSGWYGNLEAYTPNLSTFLGFDDRFTTRLLAFVDTGGGQNNGVTSSAQIKHVLLASAGIGLRIELGNKASFRLDLANVIHSHAGLSQQSGDLRGHCALNLLF